MSVLEIFLLKAVLNSLNWHYFCSQWF